MGEFSGKVVVSTGAGGHVAKALAKLFAENGALVVCGFDISADALKGFEDTVAAAGSQSRSIPCDLRDWDALKDGMDKIAAEFGRIDILINSATARTDPVWKGIEECNHEEVTQLMEVGPIGIHGAMIAAFPHMKANGGKIINFGSGGGRTPAVGLGAYSVSKAAVHSLTKSAAREWGKYKINVNGVMPFALTPTMENSLKNDPTALDPFMPPLGWIGDPERDIGRVVMFLASSASDYVTGQNIPVDGGTDMVL
jgi:NAD(P)-dependent dehydrogenase (short-subunit alcohol dehydrogenase family)